MALGTVISLVKEILPFLSDGSQDAIINSRIIQVRYFLQKYTGLSDADVEIEANYTSLQNILTSKIVAYELLSRKSIEIAGGNSSTSTPAETTFLKKAKADVVEAEFGQVDVSKSATLAASSEAIMSELKLEICSTAQILEYALPYCTGNCWDMFTPFIIVPGGC